MPNSSGRQFLIQGRNILVTGGTGTIGTALVRAILQYRPAVLRIFSRDETMQFQLQQQLGDLANVRYLIGSVYDAPRLAMAMEDIDIVFQVAAMKHVPACEYNPFEAVKTNVIGTENIIEQSIAADVKLVVGISTDKVVNPTSVMGTTKLLAEKLLIAANLTKGKHRTVFSCVRFGNVIGSRGSVIPVFMDQVRQKKPLTVTDPQMTRFFMEIAAAVDLLLKAASLAKGGEIFILPMPSVRVMDIAQGIVDRYHAVSGNRLPIEISGQRTGEKLFEELVTADELNKLYLFEDLLIIPPEHGPPPPGVPLRDSGQTAVTSSAGQDPINPTAILRLLRNNDPDNLLKLSELKEL